jgi:hypothetical protein
VTIRERSLRRFMLITPEKVYFERLYCAVIRKRSLSFSSDTT